MFVLGFIITNILVFFGLLSIPVVFYRQLIILLAKYFRPDLDNIVSGLTPMFFSDYFAKTPPRANIVVTLKAIGHFSTSEFRDIVLEKWITREHPSNGALKYKKFQQYPVPWMGFVFWKSVNSFSIQDYVHRFPDCDESKLSLAVEHILNSSYKPGQSPWEFHIIENYHENNNASLPSSNKSIIIFKIHHSLADGYSILSALVEGLFDTSLIENVSLPTPKFVKRSVLEKAWYFVKFPVLLLIEASYMFSYQFQQDSWKVPDQKKKWHQVYYKCDLVSTQDIKDIKNSFGVSFASVLLSAISSGISDRLGKGGGKPVQCLSTLPIPGRSVNEVLTNKATAAVFGIPTKPFENPLARLEAVNNILEETKQSTVPFGIGTGLLMFGSHLQIVIDKVLKNTYISMGLTNFPGVTRKMELNGREISECSFIVGGLQGNAGVVIAAITHRDHMQIELSAEEAVMTREELGIFGKCLINEVNALKKCMNEHKCNKN